MTHSVIISATRTPIGSFQGSLSSVRVTQLGGNVLKAAAENIKLDPKNIDMCIIGCVLPAGLGQAPARQAMFAAGYPKEVNALTVNKVCSSGLIAIMMADQLIRLGDANVVAAGGMESMTNSPYILPNGRGGYRLGDGKIVDTIVNDGLWDIYSNQHMGVCAEMCAKKYSISRNDQDEFAIASYKKANAAVDSGVFKEEITAVKIPQKKGDPIVVEKDEEPGRVKYDKMATLATPFMKDGTITPGNASSISDGAAATIVMSEKRAKELGVKPLVKIVSHATYSHEPEWFTTAPVGAIKRALEKAHLSAKDIDLWEINEAFSVVTMAAMREHNIPVEKVNVHGGAVALGHPIGASGARILTTLIYELKRRKAKYGLATLCNGGGEATALIVENI